MEAYLDNAATTKIDPKVLEAMAPYLTEQYGNAHSFHTPGKKANEALERSREVIASKINTEPGDVIFTSGGTESNNFALKGIAVAHKTKGNHIITSSIEHASVLDTCKALEKQGCKVTYLKVDREGFVNPQDVANAITEKTILVSIMHANNEIGTLQPLAEIGKICREKKVLFHTDAVQSFCKTNIDVETMLIDLMSLSAHKIHGPKGIGALYIRQGTKIEPLLHGGEQEFDKRSGTVNVAGAVGFAKAVQCMLPTDIEIMQRLRDKAVQNILEHIPFTHLNGPHDSTKRLCNNINISFEYLEADSLLQQLDNNHVSVSTGSACESFSLKPSHVLQAIGLGPELSQGTLRFTLSKFTTAEEIEYALATITKVAEHLRKISVLTK